MFQNKKGNDYDCVFGRTISNTSYLLYFLGHIVAIASNFSLIGRGNFTDYT